MPVPQDRSPTAPICPCDGGSGVRSHPKGVNGRLQAATAQIVPCAWMTPRNSEASSRRWSRRSTRDGARGRGRRSSRCCATCSSNGSRRPGGGRHHRRGADARATRRRSRLWELARRGGRATASSSPARGSNDTAPLVQLTEQATEAGVDAVLASRPTTTSPNRRGLRRPLRGGRRAPPTCRSCSTTSRRAR